MDIHQERLIRRAASGDDGAFEQLMLAQQKQVYNLCLRMSGNPEDAFDLSQEAFLRAWRALAQYQFEAEFSTWLFRLTRNVCIDFLRKQKRQPTVRSKRSRTARRWSCRCRTVRPGRRS